MNTRCLLCSLAFAGAITVLAVVPSLTGPASGQEQPAVEPLLKQWEKEVQARLEKDAKLKALAAKFPLVLLHSRALYAGGDYKHSAFSFIHQSADPDRHHNDVQLLFHNGDVLTESVSGQTEIPVKTWNHVAMVRDGRKIVVYLNGHEAPEVSDEASNSDPSGSDEVFIGGYGYNFEGRIDEIAIYDRPLPADEVARHYRAADVTPVARPSRP